MDSMSWGLAEEGGRCRGGDWEEVRGGGVAWMGSEVRPLKQMHMAGCNI